MFKKNVRFFPFKKFTIITQNKKSLVEWFLHETTGMRRALKYCPTPIRPYVGQVKDGQFRVVPVINRNLFTPVIIGRIDGDTQGCIVKACIRPRLFTFLYMTILLVSCMLSTGIMISMIVTGLFNISIVMPVIFAWILYGAANFAFWCEADKAEDKLCGMVQTPSLIHLEIPYKELRHESNEQRREVSFEGIDFGNGIVDIVSEVTNEDMVFVDYPNGYLLDVGWYGEKIGYHIHIIRDGDWKAPVAKYEAETDEEMYSALKEAIQKVQHESATHRPYYD